MNDVAWALRTARQVGPVHPPHAHAHPIHKLHTGPLHSPVAGRTDHLPSNVPNGSYVLPADIVSALGEGNTMAGFRIAKRMFAGARRHFTGLPYAGDNGPYGQTGGPYGMGHASGGGVTDNIHPVARQIFEKMKEHGGKGHYGIRVDEESQSKVGDSHPNSREWVNGNPTNRLLPGVSAIKAPKNPRGIHNALREMNLLEKAEGWNTPYYSGTLVHLIHSPEAPLRGEDKGEGIFKQPTLVGRWMKANSGLSPVLPNRETRANGGEIDKEGVPVAVAGGEHVLAPHEVMFAGNGDLDAGHRALDQFVIRQRAKNVKTLKKLPGPRRD